MAQTEVVEQVVVATHRWKAAIRRRSEYYARGGTMGTPDGLAREVREAEAALRAALAAAAERQKKAGSYRFTSGVD